MKQAMQENSSKYKTKSRSNKYKKALEITIQYFKINGTHNDVEDRTA